MEVLARIMDVHNDAIGGRSMTKRTPASERRRHQGAIRSPAERMEGHGEQHERPEGRKRGGS